MCLSRSSPRFLWFVAFLILSAGSLFALSQEPRIAEIRLVGNNRISDEAVWTWIRIRPGDLYRPDLVQSDFRLLTDSGLFSDVKVKRKEVGNGVEITFELEERPVITSVLLRGLEDAEEAELLEILEDAGLEATAGELYDPYFAHRARQLAKELLDRKGYPLASVSVETQGSADRTLQFNIERGPLVHLEEINFEGHGVFSAEELLESLKLHRQPAVYIPDKLEYDVQVNMLGLYKEHGHIMARATVGRPSTERKDGRFALAVTVTIEEGSQFLFGEIEVEGTQYVDPAPYLADHGIESGRPVDLPALRLMTDEITGDYHRQGFLDFETLPYIEPDVARRTVDLRIRVSPGPVYFVGRVDFSGVPARYERSVRKAILLEPDTVFDSSVLQDSVDRLNSLGYLHRVGEEDYEMTKHAEIARADVLFRLRLKE